MVYPRPYSIYLKGTCANPNSEILQLSHNVLTTYHEVCKLSCPLYHSTSHATSGGPSAFVAARPGGRSVCVVSLLHRCSVKRYAGLYAGP